MGMNTGRWILDSAWLLILLLLLNHFWNKRKALVKAQTWLKTKGRISTCEWVRVGHSVWPKIEYTYQVADQDLVGEYLFLDTWHNNPNSRYSRSMAYKVALAFKDNSEIDIYYNPNNPEQSALDVTIPKKLNLMLLLISALILTQISIIIVRIFRYL